MFESNYTQLQGSITSFAVQEFNSALPALSPTTIIRTDQPWRVHIEWRTRGLAAAVQGGQFKVNAYLESIGPGQDLRLPLATAISKPLLSGVLSAVPAPDFWQRDYAADVSVAPGVVPTDPEASRPYKLVVAITYDMPSGTPGPMAGFQEGPILQFYVP